MSKGSEIITTNPPWAFLELCATETKAVLDITTLSPNGKNLEINFSFISYTPKTKIIYLSSPNNVSGQCIRNTTSFKKFLKDLPENVLLIIDERYIEFVKKDVMEKPPIIDSLKILKEHKNIIILRSFNNFYSIENLEISYLITSKNIASLFKNSQIINQVDKFTEKMALIVINDPYYEKIKEKIYDERVRIMQTLTKSNIEFYHSDINFFLVKTQSKRDDIMVELEEENIVLYNSMDGYNNYWTLPLGKPMLTKNLVLRATPSLFAIADLKRPIVVSGFDLCFNLGSPGMLSYSRPLGNPIRISKGPTLLPPLNIAIKISFYCLSTLVIDLLFSIVQLA